MLFFQSTPTKLFLTHAPPQFQQQQAQSFWGDFSYNSTFPLLPITYTTAIQVGSMKQGSGVSVAYQPSLLPGVPSASWRHPGLHLRDTAACFWIC